MTHQFVCTLTELPEGGTREACLLVDGRRLDIFLVRQERRVQAYINRCPHTGVPLNWVPNDFLDATREQIICSTHAARFRMEDGLCVFGPCHGQSLLTLGTKILDGDVFVAPPGG